MELRHFRHFVAVAEELHFARAAERLGMEQSPLSHSIRNLEAELGVQLLQRTTRRTWLTRAGTRFYREAIRILRDVEAAAAAAKRDDSNDSKAVRLVLGEDLASEPFTRLMFELEHHNPKIELEIRELGNFEAAQLVRDRGADIAITRDPRSEPELSRVLRWSEPLMAIMPISHTFANRDRVSLGDLASEALALPAREECPGYLAQIEAMLDRHKVKPAFRRTVRHWNTAVSFAATGHAIALCPVTMVNTATTVAIVPLEETGAELATWLLYHESEVSAAVSLVLAIAEEVAGDAYSDPRAKLLG